MELKFNLSSTSRISSWRVKEGTFIKKGHVILEYEDEMDAGGEGKKPSLQKFKAGEAGVVQRILAKKGDLLTKGTPLLVLGPCTHPAAFNDMCGKCGVDLSKLDTPLNPPSGTPASYVSMIHSIPGLKVSLNDAKSIDKTEEGYLLQQRQLRLLVDLDQTLIHTTNDNVPQNLKDVIHFQLLGHGPIWYHTRLRPNTRVFLERISKLYQLHICTFGSRNYAHQIAHHLDPSGKYFYNRILSRDECFSQNSKTANLKDLFPNGDHMVCIIDDREDVWNYGPNLIHVKAYHFFRHTGDINAPPGFTKKDEDDKTGFDFTSSGSIKVVKENLESKGADVVDNTSATTVEQSSSSTKEKEVAKTELMKDITDDLLLSDDEEDELEDKANEGGSESSSEEEPTTESGTSLGDSNSPVAAAANEKLQRKSELEVSPPKKEESEKESTGQVDVDLEKKDEEPKKEMGESEIAGPEPENAEPEPEKLEGARKEDGELSMSDTSDGVSVPVVQKEIIHPIPAATNPSGKDEIEVEDEDDYLFFLEDILRQIHEAFFKLYDEMKAEGKGEVPDVKNVIPYVRRKVLKGCSIVFSGVVPVHHKLEQSRPYLVAQSLGAQVSDKIIPPSKGGGSSASTARDILPTTHVVAARLGTAKVNDARRYKGVHIVTPNWLWCSAERWERADEKLFSLCKKSTVRRHPPAHCSSPESALGQSDDWKVPKGVSDNDPDSVFAGTSSGTTTPKNGQVPAGRRGRTPSGRFMDTINPLFSFSIDEIESMGHEVDDICNESDSSSSSDEEDKKKEAIRKKPKKYEESFEDNSISQPMNDRSSSSSNNTSDEERVAAGLNPRKRKRESKAGTETEDEPLNARFRRGEPLPSDLDVLNLTNASSDEDDDDEESREENSWMARALEKELLGDESMDSTTQSRDGF